MSPLDTTGGAESLGLGAEIHALASELFPICRSLAGPGVRQTLDIIDREIGLARSEVPTGTQALDWTVPREWVVREAWIRDADGRTVVDFADCNLHLLNYSAPVRGRMTLAELAPHVFTLPDMPDRIPYRTSYYAERWGFCMRHADFERLSDGIYEVCIDAEHVAGHLSYGEHLVAGRTDREFLLSAHACHPSLAARIDRRCGRWIVNGDFVALQPTGVARYAREGALALDDLLSGAHHVTRGLDLDLVAPRAGRSSPAAAPSRRGARPCARVFLAPHRRVLPRVDDACR